ncbi:hypothetical protein Hanom_Chr00s000174g01626931 [Helianthus anomalus]
MSNFSFYIQLPKTDILIMSVSMLQHRYTMPSSLKPTSVNFDPFVYKRVDPGYVNLYRVNWV